MDPIKEITDKFVNGVNNLPLFRSIEYPINSITIAENHPIWINGTKLINGSPIIDDHHKDETRIEEFKKIGFSQIYIQWLTDSKYSQIYSSSKGSPLRWGNKTLNGTSYKGITAQNQIHDKEDYDIIHRIEIKDNHVYLNDILIASAPMKKTKAFKEKFCKAIVWSLLNDDQCLKDKLQEIAGIIAMPESVPEKVIDQGLITIEQMTGYPDAEKTDDLLYDQALRSEIEISNTEVDLNECRCNNPLDEGFDNHEYDNIEMEFYWSDLIKEMWTAATKPKIPVFPAGYLPHLNITITEERCTA